MKYYFSPSKSLFLNGDMKELYIKGSGWESDSYEVDSEVVEQFTGINPEGKVLGTIDNLPAWVDAPPPTFDQLVEQAEFQKAHQLSLATVKIAPLQDAVDLDEATEDELSQLKEWKKFRVLVNRVDTSLAPDIEWPEMSEYNLI